MKNNTVVKGILFVIIDSFFFSLMSLLVRESGDLPVFEKAFFRNLVASAASLITLARSEEKFHIKKGSMPDLWKRAIFGGTGMLLNFYAIDHIPLADANILNKMSPFFAIVASIFVLSEIPTVSEIITVIVAFFGAVLVVKPGMAASWNALAGLASGAGAGIAYTYVRKLGKHGERGPVIVAFFSIFTCAVCLIPMCIEFVPLSAKQLLYLLAAGGCAAIAQFAITAAYKLITRIRTPIILPISIKMVLPATVIERCLLYKLSSMPLLLFHRLISASSIPRTSSYPETEVLFISILLLTDIRRKMVTTPIILIAIQHLTLISVGIRILVCFTSAIPFTVLPIIILSVISICLSSSLLRKLLVMTL